MRNVEEYESTIFMVDGSLVELFGPERGTLIDGEVINFREGTWCEKGSDGEWYADWGLTWFYKDSEHPEEYTYFEQSTWLTALYNFQNMYTPAVAVTNKQAVA